MKPTFRNYDLAPKTPHPESDVSQILSMNVESPAGWEIRRRGRRTVGQV